MADAKARRAAIKRASAHVKSGSMFFRRASVSSTAPHRATRAAASQAVKKHG
jgi:hypothetical protein